MLLALVAFLAMTLQDTCTSLSELLLVRNHPWLGGVADGASDLFGYGSAGIGIVFAAKHGFGFETALIGAGIWLGSIVGSACGWHLSKHLPK